MSKINKDLETHAQRRQGLRQKASMVFVLMAAKGRGEQEKGRKLAETLSSAEVLKVNRVSVKLTPCFPLLQGKRAGLCNGVLTAPSVLSFISSMKDFKVAAALFTWLNILAPCCTLQHFKVSRT